MAIEKDKTPEEMWADWARQELTDQAAELKDLRRYKRETEKDLRRFKKYSAALEKEVKTLRDALEKYAKGKNYIGVSSDGEPFEFEENAYGLDEMEIGFAARKALKGGE